MPCLSLHTILFSAAEQSFQIEHNSLSDRAWWFDRVATYTCASPNQQGDTQRPNFKYPIIHNYSHRKISFHHYPKLYSKLVLC